jgi:hypothetical protein
MITIRLCKDCRWAALEKHQDGTVWLCTHPLSKFVPPPDHVTGRSVKPRQLNCAEARLFPDGHTCGPQGQYWNRDKWQPSKRGGRRLLCPKSPSQ